MVLAASDFWPTGMSFKNRRSGREKRSASVDWLFLSDIISDLLLALFRLDVVYFSPKSSLHNFRAAL